MYPLNFVDYLAVQVQNLIERCLQLYMNQKEVVDTLSIEAKIEPSFTELGNIALSKSISSLLATWGSRIGKVVNNIIVHT
jgi:uncharacterized protein (TIGR01589 family)